MKGKSLYLLIEELNKAERHQLLNACKRTGDKRHSSLYELLKKTSVEKNNFEDLLVKCTRNLTEGKKDEKETDKILRRFIDFSIKEIEQVKLRNFLSEDPLYRNFLLSKIYRKKGNEDIFERYLEKTGDLAKEINQVLSGYYLDNKVELISRIHNKKELRLLRELLLEKNRIIQKNYHSDLSRIYELLSFLNLEDRELIDELKELILTDEEADTLASLSSGTVEEVRYLTSKARFCFFDVKKFPQQINEAEKKNRKLAISSDRNKNEKEIALLHSLFTFHSGSAAVDVFKRTDFLSDSTDSVKVFYYQLFRILKMHSAKEKLTELKEIRKIKTEQENEFRKDFLSALISFLSGDYTAALKLLNQLSYVSNFEISCWSRLMEFRIHLRKNNFSLCESLEGRIQRYFMSNPGKLFTAGSNKTTFKLLQDEMKGKPRSRSMSQKITCLHEAIMTG